MEDQTTGTTALGAAISQKPASTAALVALSPTLRCVQSRLAFTGAQRLNGRPPIQLRRALHEESIARPRLHGSESIQHRLEARANVPLLDQIPLPLREAKPPLGSKLQCQ